MTRRRMPTTGAAVTAATLRAGTTYFALVFVAGLALGTVRTLVVAPVTGDAGAVALELPIILAISWVACGWVLQRFTVPDRASARLAMGALAFLLLMAAEVLVSVGLFGRDLASHLALYRNTPEIVGLSGQIIFALIPLFRTRGKAGVSNINTTTHRREATAGHRRTWWRRIGLLVAGLGLLVFGATYATYWGEVRATRERLSAGSQIVQTRHGAIEYATWGSGPAVLVVHGAGGGYDQGRLLAAAFGGDGARWIAPSRFGYLGTPMPADDASTAAQADAFADLLDQLGIDQVAILAISGGVPPSLQFAARHPDRTAALVLLSSAPYTPLTAGEDARRVPRWIYHALFWSDFPYWVLDKIARPSLESIFDVPPSLRAALSPEEGTFVTGMIDAFKPVTWRIEGIRNEGAAIDPAAAYALESIIAPTLVVHTRDDGLNPFSIGTYTAQHIAGAEFVALPDGGHLLLGHHAAIRAKVGAFLGDHAKRGPSS